MIIVLPQCDPTLGGSAALLQLERAEFEVELGGPVEFATADPGHGPRWLLLLDPEQDGAPTISLDARASVVVSRAADVDGLFETMNLWRTLRRRGEGTLEAVDCADLEEAIERVVVEVADTYPSFALRGLDWEAICARQVDRVRDADDPLAAFQEWTAQLADAHTWVRADEGNLPYAVRVDAEGATFVRVPPGSAAREAGVRAGWGLGAIEDEPVEAGQWLRRCGSPPHAHPYVAGRRLLAGPNGVARSFEAVSPEGVAVKWTEPPAPPAEPVTWRRLDSGAGYVRVEAWAADRGVDEALDAAFSELRGRDRLILDLRCNPGGNLVLACRTRARFLRGETELGSIRYSAGGGALSQAFPLRAEPAPPESRWPGRLVVLTDPLTYSASEDFLLGLQGLEHVLVVGGPSGGGSGRPRSLRLLPGLRLTVSTALTYDRAGRCVEGAGIPVDVRAPVLLPDEGDPALAAAQAA